MGNNTEITPTATAVATEAVNSSHPYFISPLDTPGMQLVNSPFDGESFAGWKRGILIAFAAKNKLILLMGISESVIYFTTAKDMWSDLEARFGQSSGAKLFQLQKELSDLTQGSSDIATYYTRIKRLWDELDSLDSSITCSCVCTCEAKGKMVKAKQDEKLVKFLMGLNDIYCGARGNILMISPLPSVANAYALLMQEEKQREMHVTPKFSGESSSFIVVGQGSQRLYFNEGKVTKGNFVNKKSTLVCRYCKKTRHTIEKCYKIKGFPSNFKFTKGRNNPSPVNGNAAMKNEGNTEQFFYKK
ncbi:uncharacterized protein LOC132612081 [Lycium barbarum]|uniref:uncharacterized protein LOC132612081 n=1 Tax=Lycium barbarum TaxID=112863 RepID=UPI00293EE0AD|nr:uncharacterized protein LOC132612081 [Lycium barbarum]